MKKNLSFISTVLVACAMNAQVTSNPYAQTKNLYGNLKEVAWDTKSILFGQEFYNTYKYPNLVTSNPDQSDCKSITGRHPAVLGQDFHFYNTKPWERANYKAGALKAYSQGSVVEIAWHLEGKYGKSANYSSKDQYLMYNIATNQWGERDWLNSQLDQVVNVINELKIPIICRLFHEMNGGWFWWGTQSYGGAAAYKTMYQYSVNYIKQRTKYALFAWSPNYPFTGGNNQGTNYYPGDNYVDIVGLDMYDQGAGSQSFDTMVSQLTAVSDFAWNHNKVPVFAEIGNRISGPNDYSWWWYNVNEKLQASNRAFKVAYMLTWVNQGWGSPNGQPYIPYPGSSQQAKNAFNDFVNMPTILMQPDAAARNMYNYSNKTGKEGLSDKLLVQGGDDQTKNSALISIYPNPVTGGTFSVNVGTLLEDVVTITVTDILGNTLLSKESKNEQLVTISTTGLSKGIYILKVVSADLNETHKIVIQ